MTDTSMLPHVVIVGGGFGGLRAAQDLASAKVRVTLIDRHNHHLFQPLLYQVATAGMMAESIAVPIRSVLRKQKNATVLLDTVERISLPDRTVHLSSDTSLTYDYLIVAAGARTHYFGHDDWQAHSIGLKSVEDAYAIRKRVLLAFEAAERESDSAKRRELLTFVVIGGGPTGVEMAGALSELSRMVLAKDFRNVCSEDIRVMLLEAAPSLLLAFHPNLQQNALKELGRLGVEVRTGTQVTAITEEGVGLRDGFIPARLAVWAAGVSPQPLAAKIEGVTPTQRGFLPVESDCSLKEFPNVFAIGDIASFTPAPAAKAATQSGKPPRPLPGVAPVAVQQGQHVAKMIRNTLADQPRKVFSYFDKGNMATIGKSRAVLEVGKFRMTGFFAWLAWLAVHVFLLIGFRNRTVVMFEWAWSYLTNFRGARLIASSPEPSPKDSQVTDQLNRAGAHGEAEKKKGDWGQNVPAAAPTAK